MCCGQPAETTSWLSHCASGIYAITSATECDVKSTSVSRAERSEYVLFSTPTLCKKVQDLSRFQWLFTLISWLHWPSLFTNNSLSLSDYLTLAYSHITSFVWSVKCRPRGWVILWWSASYKYIVADQHQTMMQMPLFPSVHPSRHIQPFGDRDLFAWELQVRANGLVYAKHKW